MKPETTSHLRPALAAETKPSTYDQTSAAVTAGILLAGFLFCVLFSIWLTTEFDFSRRFVSPGPPTPNATTPEGYDKDILEPGVQEFPEIAVSQLAPTLLAVTDVVSTVKASPNKRTGTDSKTGLGFRLGHRDVDKTIVTDGTPAYKRWTISYQSADLETYAKQLSFFKIDLGVIHMTRNEILRVNDPGGKMNVIKSDRAKEHQSLRFQQTKQRMRRWDQQLCKQAGVDTKNSVMCQFYSKATAALISKAEAEAIAKANRELKEVKKTTFKVVPSGDGFVFEVVEISYH